MRKKLKNKKEELEKWDADNKAKLDEDIKKVMNRSKLIVLEKQSWGSKYRC